MSHETHQDSDTIFFEQHQKEIREMRTLSDGILARTTQQKALNHHWLIRWLLVEPERTFDSRRDSKMALLTRAASKSQIVPILEIDEMSWEKIIMLSGKNPDNGEDVRIMDIHIPNNSTDPFATTVIMCQDIYISRIPFYIFSESSRGVLITDVVIPSLRTIANYLEVKANWLK